MADDLDIAIVGMACRFPGADGLEEFWKNLAAGVESITRFTDAEILASGVPASHLSHPAYVKAAPVIDAPGAFDAAFFGFSPMEARTMDPQHRILLELAHQCLEDAGCDPERYSGRVGVFAGSALNTYFTASGVNRNLAEDYIPTLINNDKDFLSTRVSYKLNLKGPSLTIQTACSTSLVAIHLARQSLLSEETDMALAGAVSVRVPHRAGYFADAGGVTSPDGHVRAFDARANGTVFGSGGAVIALKRLADAIADGDRIHAVIKGSAVNNDGSEKAGYTAPSVNSQADAVVEALANAGVAAEDVSYVETHGSGTPVGDPIEILALTKAFRASTQRSAFCAIGSVKSNIGHLDVAAGLAGLIKTVLALEQRAIPPSLHYERPNPEIDFPSTPFYVNAKLAPWKAEAPRRAGIMSTGMGGTNAHVVLEEAPVADEAPPSTLAKLLVLSARTPSALDSATARLRTFLETHPSANFDDVAFTLQTGRRSFSHRRILVCSGRDDAIAGLAANSKRLVTAHVEGRRPVVLLLPGVGEHYVGMAHTLYDRVEPFRREVDRCAEILQPHLGADIRKILYPESGGWKTQGGRGGIDLRKMLAPRADETEDEETARLNRTVHAQPALFTIEYALSRLWMHLGIVPDAIVGHSMGEYVAACLAGVMSLEDALRLIARRTQLVEPLPRGRMIAVTMPESEILPLLTPGLSVALINGPALCVVAGPAAEVDELERALATRSVITRPVRNMHAFHSRMLDPIVPALEAEVRKVRLGAPSIPYISNVTGKWIERAQATDPAYWAKHANHTARFNDALVALWQLQDPVLLEAGPGKTIGMLAMQHPDRKRCAHPVALSSLRHHYESRDDVEVLLQGMGGLWATGSALRWENLALEGKRRKISLPTYPFERQEHWIDPVERFAPSALAPAAAKPGFLRLDDWFYAPTWKRTPFPADVSAVPGASKASWLVFADRWGGGARFREILEAQGSSVQMVRFGKAFRQQGDGAIEVDPRRMDDYLALFRRIEGQLGPTLNVVHLGCLTADARHEDVAARSRDQAFGFASLMCLAQAIGESALSIPVRIGVVSNRIHEVTGGESLDPDMATVLGPVGVIPREFPQVSCFNVDLDGPRVEENPPDDVIARILSEFEAAAAGDVLAYRGKHRWRRGYERVALPAPASAPGADRSPASRRMRHRGVYLITGGTGGLGLAFARHLATTCQARIALTKKTAFPDKSTWAALARTGDAPAAVIKTIDALLEIERLGGEVEVLAAEASDHEQMRAAIAATLRKFHAINGVIHAAGIVRAGLIQAKSLEAADEVMAPKVRGTWILHDLLAELDLDFLVLFSSITSVIAPYAESDYVGANSFLDAFAAYSNARRKYRALTINWPGWREVGQLADLKTQAGTQRWKEQALGKAILTRDGLEAFTRALDSGLQQVVVSPENLDDVIEETRRGIDTTHFRPGTRGDGARSAAVGEPMVAADPPASETESAVAEIWRDVFGHEQIGVHQDFGALGGHSLIAMQIVARIRSVYRIDLSLRDFFAAPTIARLSAEIEAQVLREIEALSDDEARRLMQAMDADGRSRGD